MRNLGFSMLHDISDRTPKARLSKPQSITASVLLPRQA